MENSNAYKKVLCVRADNMGDVIMSSPAIRALKDSFGCHITLLTSCAGAIITPYLECIDDVMVADLPWINAAGSDDGNLNNLIEQIKNKDFDAALIFTVYSQSALPAALMLYLAGVPVRIAYARENPYNLLTHWLPDTEPYEHILHQVQRDLNLAGHLGAVTENDHLLLEMRPSEKHLFFQKLFDLLPDAPDAPYFVLHPGVSETKRQYPVEHWIAVGKCIGAEFNMPVLVTGSKSELALAEMITEGIGSDATCVAGTFSIGEFIYLIDRAYGLISVNTGTVHIAAARQTPTVVLYAQTNPQHFPWKNKHEIIPFSVPGHLQSRNVVISHVTSKCYAEQIPFPQPSSIMHALKKLLVE
ncbi:glycosyltransferase family 9 protein [Dyadobacter sp. CY356]|uniref:glycosyltransferase family 9 protein n=1 Tax=Dyadobacter sp. CY356 TaxID=2906442 RepID=UPI001F1F5FA8|nr:glycosyltransferase family 9 protein [Dyadobacter sp. CY356]MCF0055044.1 glycosyltransferase family 9 protein [Dyadobacter sp. CY356]